MASDLELALLFQIRATKLPVPVTEYRFHATRKWRFDLAWEPQKLAVEIEGGGWVGGRHNQPQGSAKDMEKYDEAVLAGWRVLRFNAAMIHNGTALVMIERALRE